MKPTAPAELPKENIIQKIAGIVTFRGPVRRFERWLDHKLKNHVFKLQDGVIVSGRGRRPDQRIAVRDIRAWQEIYIGGGIPFICIQLLDGRTIDWDDKYEHLLHILREIAPDREQPFAYA
jgi:hypothetical protein